MAILLRDPGFSGLAGVVSVLMGAVVSVMLVPADLSPEGALRASGISLTIGLLLVPCFRLFEGVAAAARAENILCLGLVYWLLLDLVQGTYYVDVTQSTAQLALAAIGLTAAGIWLGAIQRAWRVPQVLLRELQAKWEPGSIFFAAILCFVLGMLSFAIPSDFDLVLMFSYLGAPRFASPWSRESLGGLDAFWDHLQYFGYVLPALFVVYGRTKGWYSFRSILIFAMAMLFVAFLSQSGSRRIVGMTLGAALLGWGLGAKRINFGIMLGAVAGAAALLYSLEFILSYRGVGISGAEQELTTGIRVDDNFLRLAQVIEMVPDRFPYVYLQQILYVLVRPIPRLFWEGKPTSPGFDLAEQIGEVDISLSMTMIGEWYTMWGFPTVLIGGWFFGRLASFVNGMLAQRNPEGDSIVVPVSLMVLFVGLRGLQDLVIMSYAVLGWLLVASYLYKPIARRIARGLRP